MQTHLPSPSPSDSAGVIKCLTEIRDVLIAINHNLSLTIGQTSSNQSELNTHDGQIGTIEAAVLKLTGDIGRLTTTSSTSSGKAPKLATPDKFDGSDKNKAVSFRVAVSHYLRVSYPSSTVDEQIAFIISCLDGKAQEWLEPYLEDDVVNGNNVAWLHDLPDFWMQFNTRWNVQNKTENYRAKFRALKQTKSVQEYFKDFQTYSQNLGYNDISLRDFFYDGLSIKIKEILMTQDYDHMDSSVTLNALAEKALKIDQRLEQFQNQNKGHSSGQSSTKTGTSTSAGASGESRDKLTVGEHVYRIVDGKAQKGVIQKTGKTEKGKTYATVKWNSGSNEDVKITALKRDNHPAASTPKPNPSSSSSGPSPMDLDGAGRGKKPIICNTCGGKGHYATQCPSKSLSGHNAELSSDSESEKEDL
ncbi:hypothetical protein OPQ81_011016 [Rhizoctonia solani]|nr:hypothetical protein OPQ81_011391 [Rhizoctonia solani]KAJ1306318.1 hypothetical protein OPQ81_011016 [Rhizoctonia solani]